MSKEKDVLGGFEKKPEPVQEQPVPQKAFNYSELTEIVAKAVAAAQLQVAQTLAQQGDKNAEVLAAALRESRKPYEDPKQIENEAEMRRGMKETARKQRANKKFQQAACPHTMGSHPDSARSLPDSSFIIHTLDNSETVGICTNCQKIISSRRPEDLVWFSKKGGNVRSAAGQREFLDVRAAKNARQFMDDELPARPEPAVEAEV